MMILKFRNSELTHIQDEIDHVDFGINYCKYLCRSLYNDDDVFYLFLQKQKSAQSYVPQGYFPPYKAV